MSHPNPWLDRRVAAYAHQGGAWEAPSSTLFAIRRAVAAGATAIELDVHATADGELVVCHDETVDRTTDGSGAISSMTLAELRELDNAFWFIPGADVTVGQDPAAYPYRGRAPEDPDFRIATLAEVLDALGELPHVAVNLDVKQTAPAVASYEATLANVLEEHERRDGVIVASFFDAAIDAFAAAAPHVAVSAGPVEVTRFWQSVQAGEEPAPTRATAFQVPERYGDLVVVDEPFVAAAHRAGIAVHVWTVNDAASMERLVSLGVDGIMSDLPTTLCDVLSARHVAWEGLAPMAPT